MVDDKGEFKAIAAVVLEVGEQVQEGEDVVVGLLKVGVYGG